jgi:uncharacterized surface protein with fasciclin (FAS1) repeats
MKKTIITSVAVGLMTAMTSSTLAIDAVMMQDEGVVVGGAMMSQSRDIVDNAVLANNVTTLVAAVKAAGLVDTLKSAGPFTVFAPNNAAFAKLPTGTVETLLKTENKGMLTDILTYHVVAGRYKSSDLTDGLILTTAEGKKLSFTKKNGKLMINGTTMVETADAISSNGVTHIIDSVLMPPKEITKDNSMMMKKPMTGNVSAIAAYYGYNWKRDRASLARMAGINGYIGTAMQNIKIRTYLIKMDTMQ